MQIARKLVPVWGPLAVKRQVSRGHFRGWSAGSLTYYARAAQSPKPMTSLQYQLKAGSYYLYDMSDEPSAVTGQRRFRLKTDLLAIAFSLCTGELHQHGSPARIQSWATNQRRRLRAAGQWKEAQDIVVVSGPFPVEEINKCLHISGYCQRLFHKLASVPHGKLGTKPAVVRTGSRPASYGGATFGGGGFDKTSIGRSSARSGLGAGFATGFGAGFARSSQAGARA